MSPIVPTVDSLVSHESLYRKEGCIRIIKTCRKQLFESEVRNAVEVIV